VRPFPIDEIAQMVGGRYSVVIAAARRAEQLKNGAPPLVNIESRNPVTIALAEISAGKVLIDPMPPIAPEAVGKAVPKLFVREPGTEDEEIIPRRSAEPAEHAERAPVADEDEDDLDDDEDEDEDEDEE
jgi:DNA-directed RNA polymerase subunit omega